MIAYIKIQYFDVKVVAHVSQSKVHTGIRISGCILYTFVEAGGLLQPFDMTLFWSVFTYSIKIR